MTLLHSTLLLFFLIYFFSFFRLTSKNNFYQVINIADAYKETNFNREIDRTSGYRTKQVLCAPIVAIAGETTKITGVLQVLNRTGTHLENGGWISIYFVWNHQSFLTKI